MESNSKPEAPIVAGGVIAKPMFPLGAIVATPGALAALEEAGGSPEFYLLRHVTGDWSEMTSDDINENLESVRNNFRIVSSYALKDEKRLLIITEHDRSVTTLLLLSEY